MKHIPKKIAFIFIAFITCAFSFPYQNSGMECPDRCAQHEEECCTTEGGSVYFGTPYF